MILTDKEAMALLKTKMMIKEGHPSMPEFISWLRDRLVNVYKESPNIDFVQATDRYAKRLFEIEELLK